MRDKGMTRHEFAQFIAAAMIEPLDLENPDPQDNGYNWGLAHAEMIFAGVDLDAIKKMQGWLRAK